MKDFRARYRFWLTLAALLACPLLYGCSGSDASDGPITTDMHEDFDHEHSHQHSSDDDHEHDHDDFAGSHSHGHSHSHRHGEPLHGGRIVSIGHTHHDEGATHFHAEVMPLMDNTIHIHLLTELDDGTSKDYSIEEKSIAALVSVKGQEASAKEAEFAAVSESGSTAEFAMTLPEELSSGAAFTVVIPKLTLGGHRQNFSFKVTRAESEALNDETAEVSEGTESSE